MRIGSFWGLSCCADRGANEPGGKFRSTFGQSRFTDRVWCMAGSYTFAGSLLVIFLRVEAVDLIYMYPLSPRRAV